MPVPTIAGRPSSRLTIAACEVRPPWSVMIAAARFMIGIQSGSVVAVTRIEPSLNLAISDGTFEPAHLPVAIASPIASPVSRRSPFF